MSVTFHFVQPGLTFFAADLDFSKLFYSTDPEELKKPDPDMEPVAQRIAETLGIEVDATVSVDLSVPEEDFHRVVPIVDQIALDFQLVVFLGDTGMLFNYTGLPALNPRPYFLINSANTTWWQVTFETLNDALLDALRMDVPVVTVHSINADEEFGRSISFMPLGDGRFELRRDHEIFELSHVAESLHAAVDAVLLWVDRCPVVLRMAWESTERRFLPPVNVAQRPAEMAPNLGRLVKLAGMSFMLTMHRPHIMEFHKSPRGENTVVWWTDNLTHFVARELSDAEALTLLGQYSAGHANSDDEVWEIQEFDDNRVYHSITVAELPEDNSTRTLAWSERSVKAIHSELAAFNGPPPEAVRNFVAAVNSGLRSSLILAEHELEPQALTTLMIPVESGPATIDRLVAMAAGHGVSLVFNSRTVLYNPSGRNPVSTAGQALSEDKATRVWMMNNAFPLWTWARYSPVIISEAIAYVSRGHNLNLSHDWVESTADRWTLSVSADEECDGRFELNLCTDVKSYTARGASIREVNAIA